MPAKSKAQANLFRAAEHGASFPLAQKLRSSMSLGQMHDFAVTKSAGLPSHVKANKPLSPAREKQEDKSDYKAMHPHKNLGAFLHPKKGR